MEPRGRGRGRGRARALSRGPPQGAAGGGGLGPRPGGSRPPPPQRRPQPGPADPWNRPPVGPQVGRLPVQAQAPAQWVRPQMPAPTASAGRGSRIGGGGDVAEVSQPSPEHSGAVQASGESSQASKESKEVARSGGNGGVRGKSLRNEIKHTKPKSIKSKRGFSGVPIQLIANYFKLLQGSKWCLRHYRVDFSPDVDHTGMRKKYMRVAMKETVNGYLFDGTSMYTTTTIHPDPLEKFVTADEKGVTIRITVRMVTEIAWGDYQYIQLYNIMIRNCLRHMQLELIHRDYYDSKQKIAIPEYKLELWPGYFTSMRQHDSGILMNAELKFKIMRTDNVYDLLLECRGNNSRAEFQSKIIGSVVLTYYNNKTYKIDDVDFDRTPNSTFTMKDGTEKSYIQYYQDKYNVRIQVASQPLLVSRSKPREIRAGMSEIVLLVPELCQLTGLTDRQRENFHLMRAMADHTRVGPAERMTKLEAFSKKLIECAGALAEIERWDLKFADKLIRFQGRILPAETIVGGGGATYSTGTQADWTKELRALPMLIPEQLNKLAIICPAKFIDPCKDFVQCLLRSAKGMQWKIATPKIFDISNEKPQTYLEVIESIRSREPQLIMCVTPNNSIDRYSAIKKKCLVDRGIPSQVILAKNLCSKGVMSIATKVAIQLNCKIGGAPWSVMMPLSNLMVVGYDVCRDTTNKGKSFAAMVASLDKSMSRYFNHTSEHLLGEELSDNFGAFLLLACEKYKSIHKQYPERILIYRDGVGDGQLPYVHDHEVENIKKKLNTIYPANELKMAFVIVSKRINTRIFTDRGNPPPGTVVDDVITLPERYDFFIVSQCAKQGTVSPTSYNVISDTMGLPPDRMQILTYKLCHMYYNWSGTVRVPAPCQYAHKLAFLTAQSLHRPAHRQLESLLYYL